MKKFCTSAALILCALAGNAQEKAMHVRKNDATHTLTRLSEIKKISFLSIDDHDKAMVVSTVTAPEVTVLIEEQPEMTVSDGCLVISLKSDNNPVKFEINDIREIKFRDTAQSAIYAPAAGIVCTLRPGYAVFKGIPENTNVRVCSIDGHSMPVQECAGGELRLTRSMPGTGIFIVRIGTFVTKITL